MRSQLKQLPSQGDTILLNNEATSNRALKTKLNNFLSGISTAVEGGKQVSRQQNNYSPMAHNFMNHKRSESVVNTYSTQLQKQIKKQRPDSNTNQGGNMLGAKSKKK